MVQTVGYKLFKALRNGSLIRRIGTVASSDTSFTTISTELRCNNSTGLEGDEPAEIALAPLINEARASLEAANERARQLRDISIAEGFELYVDTD